MADNRQYSDRQRLASLRHRAESINAFREDYFQDMFALLERDPNNDGLADMLASNLDEYEEQQRMNPNWLARPPQQDDLYPPGDPPDFIVGKTTETNVPYGPRIEDNCSSLAIVGIPGGGKTTLLLHILLGIYMYLRGVFSIVFDIKSEYTCIASFNKPNVHVHHLRDLRYNALRPPPGVDLLDWLTKVATYIVEYRGLKISRNILIDTCIQLCERYGVVKDPSKPWPSLRNVYEHLMQLPRGRFNKTGDYLASLTTDLSGILTDSGSLFDTCDGIDVMQHIYSPGGIFVIQMEGVDVSVQQIVSSLLIEAIIASQRARNIRNVPMQIFAAIDEAQLILSSKADMMSRNGVAALAMQLLRAREQGVGFAVVGHLVGHISQAVLASARTFYLAGGLSDAASCSLAARLLNLPPRAETMIPRLGRGQMLAREIGNVLYTDAFLVDCDPPAIAKDIIDEPTRRQLMAAKLAAFPASPSRPLTDYPAVTADMNPGKTSLAAEDMALLIDAATHRNDWVMERSTRLGIADYKQFDQRCKSLATQKLLDVHDIRLGKVTYRLLEVTDAGFAAIHTSKPTGYIGHGGFAHTVLIARVAKFLTTNGWLKVYTEHFVGGNKHPVDVFGCSPAGVNTAFEITLSTSNVVSNAVKTFAAPSPVQELIFLCPVMAECKAVEKLLRKYPVSAALLPKIKVRRIDEYMC